MRAYRNRPDRRVAPPNPVQPIQNPIMFYEAEGQSPNIIRFAFDQNVVDVDLVDPSVLNAININIPAAGYAGVAVSLARVDGRTFDATFAGATIAGEDAVVWIDDSHNDFRGSLSGARCTGNPRFFLGV